MTHASRLATMLRCFLATCVVLGATMGASPASAAVATPRAKPDPVSRAITAALLRQQVTSLQASRYRATWAASARAARVARTSSRRANVVAVRAFTTALAARGGLVPERLGPALLSVQATTYVMLHSSSFPAHEGELRIPGEVVVFTYYSGRGVQFQPFETFKLGMGMLNQLDPDINAARAIADRMGELVVHRGSASTWEYYFPFGGPARPWTSSISQALATEFYNRVSTSVPDGEGADYEAVAASVTRSFLMSPSAGGVAVTEGAGRFYLIYPFAPAQRILNGHLQVLLNLNRYAVASGSTLARQVVDAGVAGVVPILPRFDTGAWSNYQPGQEAERSYHEFQTTQLVKLGRETGNPTLVDFGERFTLYLETPPTLTVPTTSWSSIIPALDGFRDTIVIGFRTDKRAHATLLVRDLGGREVRRLSVTLGRGTGTLVWNGRDNSGRVVADGDYVASIMATDVVGNRSLTEVGPPLLVERDVVAPELSIVAMRQSGKSTIVTARASDAGSAWIDAEVRVGGKLVAKKRGPRAGSITLTVPRPIAQVRAGTLVLRDSSGNAYAQLLAT